MPSDLARSALITSTADAPSENGLALPAVVTVPPGTKAGDVASQVLFNGLVPGSWTFINLKRGFRKSISRLRSTNTSARKIGTICELVERSCIECFGRLLLTGRRKLILLLTRDVPPCCNPFGG